MADARHVIRQEQVIPVVSNLELLSTVYEHDLVVSIREGCYLGAVCK
jgi:hypothetical protein